MTCRENPDELTQRLRALEAERLRPVPQAPVGSGRGLTAAEKAAAQADAVAISELIRALTEPEDTDEGGD